MPRGGTRRLVLHPALGGLSFGYLANGGAAAAAVIAAAEHPARVGALVLVNAMLLAASMSLPALTAPALLLLSRPFQEDGAFLVTGRGRAVRQIRMLPGSPARGVTTARMTAAGDHARQWFQRHLVPSTH